MAHADAGTVATEVTPPSAPRPDHTLLQPPSSPRPTHTLLQPPSSPPTDHTLLQPPSAPPTDHTLFQPPTTRRRIGSRSIVLSDGGTIAPGAAVRGRALTAVLRAVHVPAMRFSASWDAAGMGVVYKARQVGLNRLVALKMILSGDYAAAGDLARFRLEAEAVGQVQHPNIVQIYDIDE